MGVVVSLQNGLESGQSLNEFLMQNGDWERGDVKHSAVITDPDPPSLIESGSGSSSKLHVDLELKCVYNRTTYYSLF